MHGFCHMKHLDLKQLLLYLGKGNCASMGLGIHRTIETVKIQTEQWSLDFFSIFFPILERTASH